MDENALSVYKGFFEYLSEDSNLAQYSNDKFLIYHIGSPYPSKSLDTRNELSIIAYFKNLSKEKPVLLSQEYALSSLPYIHIGHIPFPRKDPKGISSVFWPKNNMSSRARKEKFVISPKQDFLGYITLSQAAKEYGVYRLLLNEWREDKNSEALADLEKEFLAIYRTGNRIVIIPTIVILQAFYIKSPQNSLIDALRHPTGLASMVASWRETGDETCRRGYIELTGNSHLDDADMLIYFAQDPNLTRKFNEVATAIWNSMPIKADIPTRVPISFEAECFITDCCTLVTNILVSNLIDDVVSSYVEIEVLHRKSYTWSRKPPPDVLQKNHHKNTPSDDKVDDMGMPDSRDRPLNISSNGKELESIGQSRFQKKMLNMGEREKTVKYGPPDTNWSPTSPTTRTPHYGRGQRKPIQTVVGHHDFEKTEAIEKKKIEEGLMQRGYNCTTVANSVPVPSGKKVIPLFCFCEKNKTVHRNYYILKAEPVNEKDKPFYFVWLDYQVIDEEIRRKEMLLVLKDALKMDEMIEIVDKELKDQVEHGNRKWFKGKKTHFEYKTLRFSSKFAEDPAGAIIKMVEEYSVI